MLEQIQSYSRAHTRSLSRSLPDSVSLEQTPLHNTARCQIDGAFGHIEMEKLEVCSSFLELSVDVKKSKKHKSAKGPRRYNAV